MEILSENFFQRATIDVAKNLLGKVIYHKYKNIWLKAQIIETEAYLTEEKASHSSLGYTEKKRALFMSPGTIYMYYARGKDSFNISTGKKGDAVLIKAGVPYIHEETDETMINMMKELNPINGKEREANRLCAGQTLLAKSLHLKVKDWDQKQFSQNELFIKDTGYMPQKVIKTTRLGIPKGRDEHLFYRFIDFDFREYCTKNPIGKNAKSPKGYFIEKLS